MQNPITRELFQQDRQGRSFADVLNDLKQPFDAVLEFFNNEERQKRMEESEIHHDRPALAGVVRELEAHPKIHGFLAELHSQSSKRLRQAIGVVVRMIMESRGWKKTGRKGSLGVPAPQNKTQPRHNSGGLALWFVRAERYERVEGMPFQSVREQSQRFQSERLQESTI